MPATDATAGAQPVEGHTVDLNEAEARNLAFLVSHRLQRLGLRLTNDTGSDDPDQMAGLADRVSRRLSDLSLRLGSEEARRLLGQLS